MAARAAAKSAQSLDELRAILEKFDGCALKATATRLVFADGNPKARVMLVGEAPGRDEDIEGLPFVGRSGKLLDLMLKAIGLDRTSVYIANIVPWRPPGNRTRGRRNRRSACPLSSARSNWPIPTFWSASASRRCRLCSSFPADHQGARPLVPYDTGKREIRAMPTFHPAFLLRSPLQKRFAWRDLLAVKKALASDRLTCDAAKLFAKLFVKLGAAALVC